MQASLRIIWIAIALVIFSFLFSHYVLAATYSGQTSSGGSGTFNYDPGTGCTDILPADASTVTTTDLTPCQEALGNYQNTCCTSSSGCAAANGNSLSLWQYNYASGCTATNIGGGFCSLSFQYQTQTCNSTDTCESSSYLYPGICSTTGCTVGTSPYKTCCTSTGTETCSGGQYTGICPSGNPQFCGFNSYPACGVSACAISTPTPTPTSVGCPSYSPSKNTPAFVYGSCTAGATCAAPCTDTCTVGGTTCAATSCVSYWACQGGTQWYNDGTYYDTCPSSCGGVCTPGATQVLCNSSTKTCNQ